LSNIVLHLAKSNVVFMGDAFRNDWLMYAGPNGPDAHIQGLDVVISLANSNTQIVPSNRFSKPVSNLAGLEKARMTYQQFVNKVKALNSQGLSIQQISSNPEVNNIISGLERYDDFKQYTQYHVQEIVE
jgi:hypothetical protein